MIYRALGNTGLRVSQVSFGCIRFDGLDQPRVTQLVKRAIDGGINYFDTARAYGSSEVYLGQALRELGARDRVILSSKVIRRDLDAFKQDFETTMRNLQTDYLDILFLHDVSTRKNWDRLISQGTLDYALELKKQGRIGHLAISTHDGAMGEMMIRTGHFEIAMLAYNPIGRDVEQTLLPLCTQLGLGVVIMKPLGGGVLSEARSAQLGFSVTAKECLEFAVSNPHVSCIIPGMDKPEYVDTALEVGAQQAVYTDAMRDALTARISLQGKNYCRGCGYCLPCVKNIPIPTVLALLNRSEAFGGLDWSQTHQIAQEYTQTVARDRLPEQCIACGACVTRCPYNLPIPQLMKEAAAKLRRYD